MKKTTIIVILILTLAGTSLMSCSKEESKKNNNAPASTAKAETKGTLPNYRYVDIDTILSKYNLAKDYDEEMVRKKTQMENEMKSLQSSLQNKAASIQQKMQNNGYTSEAGYKADANQYANMESNAQKRLADMGSKFDEDSEKARQTVLDSIDAFIKDYNVSRGYDAIFIKNATLYINPALDITSEVVEGLNSRYNKVSKK